MRKLVEWWHRFWDAVCEGHGERPKEGNDVW